MSLLLCLLSSILFPIPVPRWACVTGPDLLASLSGALLLQLGVEVVATPGAGHVVAVPEDAAHDGTNAESNAEIRDETPSEHTGDGLDGHCDFEGSGGGEISIWVGVGGGSDV